MTIRAVVVDDEPLSRRVIRQLLAKHPDVEVLRECRDGTEANEALAALDPDLVFLDIRMPEVSGLDVARARTSGSRPFVVFVTAFDQFALPAFETEATDYLTKPVTQERFDVAMRRVREQVDLRARATRYDELASETPERYVDRLVARVGDRDLFIPVDTIDFIAADDVYALVHHAGKKHLVRTALDALERDLDPVEFVRVHRSFIVRIDRITAIRRGGNGTQVLVLSDGTSVPISRRRRLAVTRALAPRAER